MNDHVHPTMKAALDSGMALARAGDAGLGMVAKALTDAADQLAKDNAEAAKKAEDRFDAALRHYVENPRLYTFGGFCNLVGCLVTLCGRMTDTTPEGSEAEADWLFAEQVMDAALSAVDLCYGEESRQSKREKALAAFRELVAELKA